MRRTLRSITLALVAALCLCVPLRAMILLTATTSSLEVVLGGAVSSTQLAWVASYADITTTTFTPGSATGATNGASAVTLIAAPGASTQRQVKFLSVYNADSASAAVTIQYDANGTLRTIVKTTLPAGYTLTYTDGRGFVVLDANGAAQVTYGDRAPSDAQYWLGAASTTLGNAKNLGVLSTGLVINTAGTPSAFTGTSCTNQFPRSLSASGAATCATVSLTLDITGTLTVSNGGTGIATTTAYGLLAGGTTATGLFQNIGTGTSGYLLKSNGNAALPSYVATGAPVVVALVDGATPALDASLGTVFTLTAAGDRTIAVPSNATSGQKIIIAHLASGAGRTLALNTGAGGFRFGSDITSLSQTASGKTDYIGAVYNASASFWDVVAVTKGF